MFDTSVVRSRAVAAPRRFALLSISFAIHTAVAIAVLATSVATVEFPGAAPPQMEILRPVMAVSVPPALGPGGPPKREPAATPPSKNEPPRPQEITAPPVIPEETPQLDAPGTASDVPASSDAAAGEGTGPGGGDPNGVVGGMGTDPAGSLIGTPGQGTIHLPGGDVRAARVLTRVEPRYPPAMVAARKPATVTVRCVIDRNGRARDPEILMSTFPPFNTAVLEAVQQWTFAPGTLRGQPVETWFELTVRFEVR